MLQLFFLSSLYMVMFHCILILFFETDKHVFSYTGDCPELQLRRLGDLWFMLGQWNQAFQAYHAAKREFSADGAWLCYAGALEMAALSAFMGGETSRKTLDYMEEGILTYLNSCRYLIFRNRFPTKYLFYPVKNTY
jgi:hypothetical protein